MYSRVAPLRKGAYRPSMACASLSRRAETIFFSCLDFYLRNQLAGLPHFSVRNTRTLLVADWPKRLPLSLRHASRDPPSEQGIGGFIAKLLPRGVQMNEFGSHDPLALFPTFSADGNVPLRTCPWRSASASMCTCCPSRRVPCRHVFRALHQRFKFKSSHTRRVFPPVARTFVAAY